TALREIEEECGLRVSDPGNPLVLTSTETPTGFVQLYFIGIAITLAEKQEMEARAARGEITNIGEGTWSFVKLETIVRKARNAAKHPDFRFVPTGAMIFLTWLGLGAPDQHRQRPM